MILVKCKRKDTGVIWDVTRKYYEQYKDILEYIEEFDSDSGTKVDHPEKAKVVDSKHPSQMNKEELVEFIGAGASIDMTRKELLEMVK